jgi:hypothetical protein
VRHAPRRALGLPFSKQKLRYVTDSSLMMITPLAATAGLSSPFQRPAMTPASLLRPGTFGERLNLLGHVLGGRGRFGTRCSCAGNLERAQMHFEYISIKRIGFRVQDSAHFQFIARHP